METIKVVRVYEGTEHFVKDSGLSYFVRIEEDWVQILCKLPMNPRRVLWEGDITVCRDLWALVRSVLDARDKGER